MVTRKKLVQIEEEMKRERENKFERFPPILEPVKLIIMKMEYGYKQL